MTDFPTALLVVAVALIAPDRRVLMQRRRSNRTHGGLWEFPGGKVEPGESPEQAIFREIREELGVALDRSSLQPVSFAADAHPPAPPLRSYVILLYTCERWQGDPTCLDAEEIAWVAPEHLARLAMPPLDYPLARALQKVI